MPPTAGRQEQVCTTVETAGTAFLRAPSTVARPAPALAAPSEWAAIEDFLAAYGSFELPLRDPDELANLGTGSAPRLAVGLNLAQHCW